MASNVSSDRPRISASAISSMMRPRSLAIVGVSAKPGSAGRVVLELLDNNKFTGPVHHQYCLVAGIKKNPTPHRNNLIGHIAG